MNSEIEKLKNIILNSNNIVFFGGAGVSTESGIPDFRSADGLYQNNPETILSHSFFLKNPEIFFEFYKKNLIFTEAKPNAAHNILAKNVGEHGEKILIMNQMIVIYVVQHVILFLINTYCVLMVK